MWIRRKKNDKEISIRVFVIYYLWHIRWNLKSPNLLHNLSIRYVILRLSTNRDWKIFCMISLLNIIAYICKQPWMIKTIKLVNNQVFNAQTKDNCQKFLFLYLHSKHFLYIVYMFERLFFYIKFMQCIASRRSQKKYILYLQVFERCRSVPINIVVSFSLVIEITNRTITDE